MTPRRCFNRGPALVAVASLLLVTMFGNADAASHKRRAAPVTSSRDIETDTTATIPAKPPIGASAAKQDDQTLPPPFHLPTAPRKRMRDCGLKWQAMKMSGAAGDDTWRAFATHCLAAVSGSSDTKQHDR